MKIKVFEAPSLYADHHVTEVRRILLEIDGVTAVYASSAFQIVEITYDENKISESALAVKLDEAGYLGAWTVPSETRPTEHRTDGEKPYFRHTTTYETLKQTVSFAQHIKHSGRPLWQCPGFGKVRMDEEMDHA